MSDCIFCKIISGEIPGKIVHSDDEFIAFYDINPKAPVHVLVCPKKHIESLRKIHASDGVLMGKMMVLISELGKKLDLAEDGYKVVLNNGAGSGQLVFHMHAHILGGWRKAPQWDV